MLAAEGAEAPVVPTFVDGSVQGKDYAFRVLRILAVPAIVWSLGWCVLVAAQLIGADYSGEGAVFLPMIWALVAVRLLALSLPIAAWWFAGRVRGKFRYVLAGFAVVAPLFLLP